MRRRAFLAGLGGLLALVPAIVNAQSVGAINLTKPVNLSQLETEAEAIPGTTHGPGKNHFYSVAGSAEAGNGQLSCTSGGALIPVCAFGLQAYTAHVANFTPKPSPLSNLLNQLKVDPALSPATQTAAANAAAVPNPLSVS